MNVQNIIIPTIPAMLFFTLPHLVPAQDAFLAVTIAHWSVHDVGIYDFETGTARNMSLKNLVDPVGVAVDLVEGKVYFSDRNQRILGRANLNGTAQEVLLRFGNKTSLEHIALNPRSRLLFWVDAGRGAIFVSNLQFTAYKKLIDGDLEKPRALAVDSENSYLYWSEWFHQGEGNRAKIERATMTGENREVIVEHNLVWPNGIVLDKEARRLFWCDASLDRIESVNLDGSNRSIIIENTPYLQHSFSIALYGEFIFWTDARTSGIIKADKKNGTVIDANAFSGQAGINGLSVATFDQGTNDCSRNNGGCFSTQLCLPKPSGRDCFCLRSRDDDRSCFYESEEPLYPTTPQIPGERPVIIIRDCPGDTTITLPAQMESITVTWVEPVATGSDGSTLEADQSHAPGEYFKNGNTTVIYVYEFKGETAICSFDVIVKATTESITDDNFQTIFIWVGIGVTFFLLVLALVCVSVCMICLPRDKTFRRDGNLVAMETVENAPIDGDINTLTSQVSLSVELQFQKPNGERTKFKKTERKKKSSSPENELEGVTNMGFHTYEELPARRYTDYKTNFEDSGRFNTMR